MQNWSDIGLKLNFICKLLTYRLSLLFFIADTKHTGCLIRCASRTRIHFYFLAGALFKLIQGVSLMIVYHYEGYPKYDDLTYFKKIGKISPKQFVPKIAPVSYVSPCFFLCENL